MSDDVRGLRSAYAGTSETNAQDYHIKQYLRQVYTTYLGIINSCESQEENSGATMVSATPAVQQTDGQDNALPMAEIPKCPHYRVQQGICALVIDPVPGDIGVFCAPKADSTTINSETTEPQRPGSLREFNQSNSIMVGTVHTKKPENWITLRQDKTRETYAPEGVLNRTDKNYRYEIGQDHEWQIGRDAKHEITNDLTANIGNNVTIEVGNNVTITIGADKSITISGNFQGTIQGNFTGQITGTADLTVMGPVSITAPAGITITSPQTTITGNVTIGGNLSCDASTGGGNAEIAGNVTARGTVHSDSDVTANVSLNSHVHGGVETGGGTTGGPR